MPLSKRLELCARSVVGDFVCDVGTDHALLPIFLIENGICKKAFACDIADGPLEIAKKNIANRGMGEKIAAVKSDGLRNVDLCGVTDIVIAGMGGETIRDILYNDIGRIANANINLILQPMTRADILRKWLCENGFFISGESCADEGKFIYSVICAKFCAIQTALTDEASILGKIDLKTECGRKYAEFQAKRLKSASDGLKNAKANAEADRIDKNLRKISCKLEGNKMTISEIYDIIDFAAPFRTQDSFDNSGLIVGSPDSEVDKVLVALDITSEVVSEAKQCGAQLIVSHHPVIFSPIKSLGPNDIPYQLANASISAICAHTCLDMAKGGVNDAVYDLLKEPLQLGEKLCILEEISSGLGYGGVCELKSPISAENLAKIIKDIFGCTVVKYFDAQKPIKRLAYCSGSGGSALQYAISAKADAYLTGDIKHSVWIEAQSASISLFDCGHYHTERIILPYIKQLIENNTTGVEVLIAESDRDILDYCF